MVSSAFPRHSFVEGVSTHRSQRSLNTPLPNPIRQPTESMAPAPAWALLPPDLLGCVLERLPAMDHLSFACVCAAWRAAASSGLHPPVPHPPCLMLPVPRHRRAARFLSLNPAARRRTCTIPQPDPPIRGRAWIGTSADGWVVTADDRSELHLLNPVTGVQFDLPSVTTFPFVEADMQDGGSTRSYRLSRSGVSSLTVPACDLRFVLFVKAIAWWSDPSHTTTTAATSSSSTPAATSGRSYTVAVIYRPYERLAFARSGDRAWRTVDLLYAYGFTDLIHHRGWLLTVDAFGQVAAWDLAERPAPVPRMLQARLAAGETKPGHTSGTNYLVESAATGALLMVLRQGAPAQGKRGGHRTAGFRVFRLDVGRVRWVEVVGLGGEALFLGRGSSVAAMAGSSGVEGDCVYYTDDFFGCPEAFHGEGGDMGVFCMGDGSVRKLSGVEVPPGSPSPIWITPRLQ